MSDINWQPMKTAPKNGKVVLLYPRDGHAQLGFYKKPWYHKCLLRKFKDVGSMWMSVYPDYATHIRENKFPVYYCEYKPLGRDREPIAWAELGTPEWASEKTS